MPKTKTTTLTATKATSQAAARVRNLMPGEIVTASTERSWNLATDRPRMITRITFPPNNPCATLAYMALTRLSGVVKVDVAAGYLTVVREA